MKNKKSGSGGKLNRSVIVQARLNPKLHFSAELVARLESRTLSSFIETTMNSYLKNYRLGLAIDEDSDKEATLMELIDRLWDPDVVVRFVKVALLLETYLTSKEQDLWAFMLDTRYFWAHYEVTVNDYQERFIRKEWEPYYNINGLLVDNVKEYWSLIQTDEGRASVVIPDQRGGEIEPPADVEKIIYEEFDYSKPLKNDMVVERDRYSIWLKNISRLVKKEFETIQTSEGEKVEMKIIYPTPEEQSEMVERIYQEQLACLSSSTK